VTCLRAVNGAATGPVCTAQRFWEARFRERRKRARPVAGAQARTLLSETYIDAGMVNSSASAQSVADGVAAPCRSMQGLRTTLSAAYRSNVQR
jgi:hypothetical protein